MPKRRREEEDVIEGIEKKKRKKGTRKETPSSRFRKQTILRKKALLKVIRDSNTELRAITRDLGKLKRK